jgi:hypothetical protein
MIIPKEIETLQKKQAELEEKVGNLSRDFDDFCIEDYHVCEACASGHSQCDPAKLDETTDRLRNLKATTRPKALTAYVRDPSSLDTPKKSADPILWDIRDPQCILGE